MKERILPRKPVVLSESTQRRLGMYALTASAASVGVLALVQSAEAKVVYTPVTGRVIMDSGAHCFDLNHDGLDDFCLSATGDEGFCFLNALAGSKADAIAASDGNRQWALAIRSGAKIGAARNFINSPIGPGMASHYCTISAPWYGRWVTGKGHKGLTNRYLGIRFVIGNKIHYAWARCSVDFEFGGDVIMSGYAYETIPNKPIIAGKTKGPDVVTMTPQPGTLGHLALGRR